MPNNALLLSAEPRSCQQNARRRTARAAAALLALLALLNQAPGGEDPANVWRTGAALDRQLQTSVDLLSWSGKPLRLALESLSSSQGVAIFLDRRIDPDQLLEFESRGGESLSELIDRLAGGLGLEVSQIGPVMYLGPPSTAAVLATVVELRREDLKQSRGSAPRGNQVQPLAWPPLTTPRELIAQQVRQAGLSLDGLEQIPHDLWPGVDLPPMDLAERLSLLLAGFGKTFQVAGGDLLQLVPLPPNATLARDYPLAPALAERMAGLIRQKFPTASVARRDGGLAVQGTAEVHSAIERWRRGESSPPAPKPAGDVRYTLEVKNQPLGAIAAALADRLSLEIEFDPQAEPLRQQRVSFRVEQVSRAQLLEALLAPAGLTYRITGSTLRVLSRNGRAAPDR